MGGPTSQTTERAALSYGRLAPLHRRAWFHWCLCAGLMAGLLTGSWAAWQKLGLPWQRERARQRAIAQEQARVEALKREWMAYREPPDRVVYAEHASLPPGGRAGEPRALSAPRRAWPFAPAEARFPTVGPPHGGVADADREVVLLLHGRRTPAGHERAVLVVAYPDGGAAGSTSRPARSRSLWFWYAVVDLAAWSGKPPPPPPKPPGMSGSIMRGPSARHPATRGYGAWRFPPHWERFQRTIRLFAGQPDPDDPTHFTIGYEYDGQTGTIDGHLQDATPQDGERIHFVVRDGPVASRGPEDAESPDVTRGRAAAR